MTSALKIAASVLSVIVTSFFQALGDPKGSPSKIAVKVHYVKYMGIKVMTQH